MGIWRLIGVALSLLFVVSCGDYLVSLNQSSGGSPAPGPASAGSKLSPADQQSVQDVLAKPSNTLDELRPLLASSGKPAMQLVALSRLQGSPEAVAEAKALLEAPETSDLVRVNALGFLIRASTDSSHQAVQDYFDRVAEDERVRVVDVVGLFGTTADMPLLAAASTSQDATLRAHASSAMQQVEGR